MYNKKEDTPQCQHPDGLWPEVGLYLSIISTSANFRQELVMLCALTNKLCLKISHTC